MDYFDQERKLERRTLRAANEVFLKLLRAEYRRAERNRRAREAYEQDHKQDHKHYIWTPP